MLSSLRAVIKRLKADRRGVTALEYGLLAALVGTAIALAATPLGNAIANSFSSISTHLVPVK
jgi:pilus assembly protein Flp/PilA